jgi:hypothetical protein
MYSSQTKAFLFCMYKFLSKIFSHFNISKWISQDKNIIHISMGKGFWRAVSFFCAVFLFKGVNTSLDQKSQDKGNFG